MTELKDFFCAQRVKMLEKYCKDWDGVKYRHMGNNKFGIDCTKLIARILVAFNVLEKVEDNIYYSRDWFIHSKTETALDEIVRHFKLYSNYLANVINYGESEVKAGDILFLNKNNMPCNHTVFYLGNDRIFHAIDGIGCTFAYYDKYWKSKAKYILRIKDNNPWA